MSRAIFVLLVVVAMILTGCTSMHTARGSDAASTSGFASPGPDLVGRWQGTAFAVPGANYYISAPVDLQIRPDGTWTWSKQGQQQAVGRVVQRGDRLFFEESRANEGAQRIVLQRRGDEISGLSRAFIPGAISAVQLHKVS
jgi:hypothetical protein